MTCIVSLVRAGKVYMAADSAMSTDDGDIWLIRDPKAFVLGSFAFGIAGVDHGVMDAIRYGVSPPRVGSNLEDTLRTGLMPRLRKALAACEAKLEGTEILFGVKGRLFELHDTGAITENESRFAAIGNGQRWALGALEVLASTELAPREILKRALTVTAKHCWSVRAPWRFVEV